jgi:VanZ like protein
VNLLFGATPVSGLSVILLVVGLAVALIIWLPLVRWLGWQPASTLALLVAIVVMLTITLHPGTGAGQAASLTSCVQLTKQQVLHDLAVVVGNHQELVGVAVMIPVGFFAAVAARRGAPAAVLVLVLPGVIELAQLKVTGRDCNAASFLLTGLGGLIGVAIGVAVNHFARTATR